MTDNPTATQINLPLHTIFNAVVVSPSDSTTFELTRSFYVGTGGDIAILLRNNESAIYKNVPDGSHVDVQGIGVLSTGTTASDILAEY